MHGRIALIMILTLAGCTAQPPASRNESEEQEAKRCDRRDARATGAVTGRVSWDGAALDLPHAPIIDGKSRGIKNAVVYLRGIDPRKAKAWDHAPVRVEFKEHFLGVTQGNGVGSVGVVRVGDEIEVINREPEYRHLRLRGAAFGGMPLAANGKPHRRVLDQAGLVHLTSATFHIWMSAHLFVVEHPYYALTDEQGRFTLDKVPAGRYELVCWMRNWNVVGNERYPEGGMIARLKWGEPKEQKTAIEVRGGTAETASFTWSEAMFR